jgi:hypothetical protein
MSMMSLDTTPAAANARNTNRLSHSTNQQRNQPPTADPSNSNTNFAKIHRTLQQMHNLEEEDEDIMGGEDEDDMEDDDDDDPNI